MTSKMLRKLLDDLNAAQQSMVGAERELASAKEGATLARLMLSGTVKHTPLAELRLHLGSGNFDHQDMRLIYGLLSPEQYRELTQPKE